MVLLLSTAPPLWCVLSVCVPRGGGRLEAGTSGPPPSIHPSIHLSISLSLSVFRCTFTPRCLCVYTHRIDTLSCFFCALLSFSFSLFHYRRWCVFVCLCWVFVGAFCLYCRASFLSAVAAPSSVYLSVSSIAPHARSLVGWCDEKEKNTFGGTHVCIHVAPMKRSARRLWVTCPLQTEGASASTPGRSSPLLPCRFREHRR